MNDEEDWVPYILTDIWDSFLSLKEAAEYVGISIRTYNRGLNGARLSENTRKKIKTAYDDLGWEQEPGPWT